MDVDKQVAYWQKSGKEDWDVGLELINSKRTRHGLFFAHLAIEKTLKALVCRETKTFPPKTHNLLVLAQKANLKLSHEQKLFVARFDRYQLEGRYPDTLAPAPGLETASQEIDLAKDFLKWLAEKF
ncbi:MAG: HEPN domain-containing protein [Anaerolinea sp.]|nr:HEPN domain-containing protein [Anaerolinea sp.]